MFIYTKHTRISLHYWFCYLYYRFVGEFKTYHPSRFRSFDVATTKLQPILRATQLTISGDIAIMLLLLLLLGHGAVF